MSIEGEVEANLSLQKRSGFGRFCKGQLHCRPKRQLAPGVDGSFCPISQRGPHPGEEPLMLKSDERAGVPFEKLRRKTLWQL